MPAPSPRSRLAKALAASTGQTIQWVYRLLKSGGKPKNRQAAAAWARVVARERSRSVVAGGAPASSCPQPSGTAVRSPGRTGTSRAGSGTRGAA